VLSQPLPQPIEEMRRRIRSARKENADSGDARRLLRLGGERHKKQAERENDREPDQSHAAGEFN